MPSFPITRMGMKGAASIGVGGAKLAGWLLREAAEADSQALMNGVSEKIYGAMGRAVHRIGQGVQAGSVARQVVMESRDVRRRAAFNALSEAEQDSIMRRQRIASRLGMAGGVAVGLGVAVPAAALSFGAGEVMSRGSRFPAVDSGIVGYPGTPYVPPPDMGADGDLVLAAHKSYGAGSKNRDMK